MKTIDREFVPVLLGNDINTYSMARAFYEAYQIKSVVIGKYLVGPSCSSKIIDYYAVKNLDQKDVFIQTINNQARQLNGKKIILLGCGDNYVEQIITNRQKLGQNIIVPYIEENLMRELITKESFYQMCDRYQLEYPPTFIYTRTMQKDYVLPFDFPVILKPSSGIQYWQHEFAGQKKVYKIADSEELQYVIDQIYNAGYNDNLVIQEFIPGDDTYMRVMTCFSGRDKKVKLMSLGHVMLEEHTPHGLGNHAVIMNDYNEELAYKLKNFLESIGYIGFSNFDIKYDQRDGRYKLFEINIRQGRSNYYVTGAGYNLAKYIASDFVFNQTSNFKIVNTEHLWTVVPMQVTFSYVKDPAYADKMKQLMRSKKITNPLFMQGDNLLPRMKYLYKSHLSHFFKYKKYYK